MTSLTALATIPGLPAEARPALLGTLAAHPGVEQLWLYGSRAMGQERPGFDIDLSLEGSSLSHADLLELSPQLEAHLQRVCRLLLRRRFALPS